VLEISAAETLTAEIAAPAEIAHTAAIAVAIILVVSLFFFMIDFSFCFVFVNLFFQPFSFFVQRLAFIFLKDMHRFELAVDVAYHNSFGFKRRELSAASRCLDCDYSISDPLLQNSDKKQAI
jgi:hypothetical protein